MGKRTPQDVWDQMRLSHAQGVGLRELARAAGIKEDTVLKRASREKWNAQLKAAASVIRPQGEVINVLKVVENTVDDLKLLGEKTRSALAKASHKVAEHVASMEGEPLLQKGDKVRPWQQIAASVHGWDKPDPQAGRGGVNIAITITREDMKVAQVVDVESETKRIEG